MYRYRKTFYFILTMAIGLMAISCHKDSAFRYPAKPQATIDAKRVLSNEMYLTSDTVYILAVNINRDSGQSLTIEAGTLIKVNDNLSVNINRGARIEASGNQTAPIVFTSSAAEGTPGNNVNQGTWTGIRINGNDDPRGSGVLSYVRIEFAGNYAPALMLSQVTNKTTVNHIEISYTIDRTALELDGGNCNISEYISYANAGTDLWIHNGYTGMMQNLLIYRHPYYATNGPNLTGVYVADYPTHPIISNLSVIGPDAHRDLNGNYSLGGSFQRAAFTATNNSLFHLRNSVFLDFPLRSIYMDNYNSNDSLDKFISDLSFNTFYNTDSSKIFVLGEGSYPGYNSTDFRNFMMRPVFVNKILTDRNEFRMPDVYNYFDGVPNPMPEAGSPVLTGADFSNAYYQDPFFEKVNYVGALGEVNWMTGWANFIPLQTNYNN